MANPTCQILCHSVEHFDRMWGRCYRQHLQGLEEARVVLADEGLPLSDGLLGSRNGLAQCPDGLLHLAHRRRR